MGVIFLRTLIIFIVLVVVMRLMGKRQIGEMQPFEFIVTLIIADLACIPMADISIPLIYGIIALLTLFLLHQLLSLLEHASSKMKKIISGKPSVVINKNGVDMIELKKNNMDVEDLIESMRACGYFSLDDLSYAIFESNGKLSPFENQDRQSSPTSIPILIINDGKINSKNVTSIAQEDSNLLGFLKSQNLSLKKIEVMTVDGAGRCYLKAKDKKYQIINYPLGDVKW